MTPDLWERISAALDEMSSLKNDEKEQYLTKLAASEPDVARHVHEMVAQEDKELSARLDRLPSHYFGQLEERVGGESDDPPRDKSLSETIDATVDMEQSTLPHAARFTPPKPEDRTAEGILGKFRDYELVDEIARGGMGVVYKARQIKLNRTVAIKMILTGQLASNDEVRRFYTEAEAAAKLDHPGIVPIYEVGEHGGQHYFSMGFVEGGSLADHASGQPLPQREAAELSNQIAEAVQYAHEQGIVHRDLKPRNILLQKNSSGALVPKITDFGLAAKVEGDHELTTTGQILGTPSYMPPEQADGRISDVGPRSDVYALGAVLYCLLTGRPPFQLPSVVDTIRQILESEPVSPRLLNPGVDRDLETICLKCLEKDPTNRYQSAGELAAELQRYLDGEPIRARRIGPVARGWRWIRRRPMVAALATSLMGLVVLLSLSFVFARRAIETRQLSELSDQVEQAIEEVEVTEASVEAADQLIARLSERSTELGSDAVRRLDDRLAAKIRQEIRQPKLEPEQFDEIGRQITLLEARTPASGDELRTELAKRRSVFQNVFRLAPPFQDLQTIFPAQRVQPAADGSGLMSVPRTVDAQFTTIATRPTSEGQVQFEATFDQGWPRHHRLGVALNQITGGQGYQFLLSVKHSADEDEVLDTFQRVREQDGNFIMTIERNGLPLLRREIHHSKIGPGPLRIRCSRERGTLGLQVGSLPREEFRDPFPLNSAQPGAFAIVWPATLKVVDVQARRRPVATQPSSLEQGDSLFDQGEYSEALAFYQLQERETDQVSYKQEARYKQASCLMQLNRNEEAAAILSDLLGEPEETWPPLAGCQLWVLRLRQNRQTEADAIYDTLASRFRFEQLASLIPNEIRREILTSYRTDFRTIAGVLRYNPDLVKNTERLAAVDRLLSADGKGNVITQLEVSRAYRMMGDFSSALVITENLIQDSTVPTVIRHHSRLLRLTGQTEKAKQVMLASLGDGWEDSNTANVDLLAELARVYAALDNWTRCEEVVDHVYRRHGRTPIGAEQMTYIALMKGFLLRRRGATRPAHRVWSDAYQSMQSTFRRFDTTARSDAINMMILGSLTSTLTPEDAQLFFSKLVTSGNQNPLVSMAQSMLRRESLASAFRRMWTTPRGMKYAEAFAFESLTLPQRVRIPLALAATGYASVSALQGDVTPDQDQVLFDAANQVFEKFFVDGTLTPAHAAQLSLTWRGTTNLLGWAGAAPSLPADFRAHAAYMLAHKYIRLKQKPQAIQFFETAIKDTEPDSLLARTAAADLELLKAGAGRLKISTTYSPEDYPLPIEIIIRRDGEEVQRLAVEGTEEIHLPPGRYSLAFAEPHDQLRFSATGVLLPEAGSKMVDVDWLWQPAEESKSLTGIIPLPSSKVSGGRWQVHFRYPDAKPNAIAWSADDKRLAVGAMTGQTWILDGQSKETVGILTGHQGGVGDLAWSPLGARLATTGWDNRVRVWDTRQGTLLRTLMHKSVVRSVAWSADGSRFASCGNDRVVRVWGVDGQALHVFGPVARDLGGVSWNPNGQQVAARTENQVQGDLWVWRISDGDIARHLQDTNEGFSALAWSPDGRWLAVGGWKGTIKIWRTDDWSLAPIEPQHEGRITSLKWSPDSKQLHSGSIGWQIRTWALDGTNTPIHDGGSLHLGSMDVNSAGVVGAIGYDHVISFGAIGEVTTEKIGFPKAEIRALDVSREGRMAVGRDDGDVLVLNHDGVVEYRSSTKKRQRISDVRWSPDGGRCVYARRNTGYVYVYDASERKERALPTGPGGNPEDVAWSPDGKRLLVGHAKGSARIWNVSDGTVDKVLDGHHGAPSRVDWSSTGLLATADHLGVIRIWKEDGQQVTQFELKLTHPLRDLRFSPNGESLLVLDQRGVGRLLRVDGTAETELAPYDQMIRGAWSPDGRQIVTTKQDGTVFFWNATGELRAAREGHQGRANAAAWIPRTNEVITGGEDLLLRTWSLDKEHVKRITALLPNGSATFTAGGRLLRADEAINENLVYARETQDGGMRLRSPREFHELYKLTWPETKTDDPQPSNSAKTDTGED